MNEWVRASYLNQSINKQAISAGGFAAPCGWISVRLASCTKLFAL
jgi:hypothetical protein